MIKKRLPHSLTAQVVYDGVIGLFIAVAVYFLFILFGNILVQKIYMSDSAVNRRKTEIYNQFTSFVSGGNIAGSDSASIARFTAKHEYVSIVVYGRDSRYYRFSGGESNTGSAASYDSRQFGRLFAVRFRDGVYQVAIIDESETGRIHMIRLLGLLTAAVAFLTVSFFFSSILSKRVIELSHEASLVSSGDLEREIKAEGDDEITALAASMDEMRRSVIDRMGKERQAWEANSRLITAISHDIRTPMTSVIGYLGLLCESDFSDPERCRQFADIAYGKAMELKYLTDELFRYFLVFGRAELDMSMEKLDGATLWEQLIGEAEFDLRDAGFTVERNGIDGTALVEADPMYLNRVMGNMVANVKKYADPSQPVEFRSALGDGALTLTVTNAIASGIEHRESTRIGLMTCRKIMEHMKGSFVSFSHEGSFTAKFSLPVSEQKTDG